MTAPPDPTAESDPAASEGLHAADGPAGPVTAALATTLTAALAAGTREAFTALLTDDVRWGGERPGEGNECTTREQAGDHYAGLLAAGVSVRIADLQPAPAGTPGTTGTTGDSVADVFTARMAVRSPDPDDYPPEMPVRLTLREGLISEICILDPPPTIEVLYFDGCPHFEQFLPHLTELLAAHRIPAPVMLTRINGDDDAQAHRFLGSPTVRIDGVDVEPAVAEREMSHRHRGDHHDPNDGPSPVDDAGRYGMQCRLYANADGNGDAKGTGGLPADRWILDRLIANPDHEAAVTAVRTGDLPTLRQLLTDHPDLATARLARRGGRTLLHASTDWPGHYPNVAATIAALVAAGADPNVGCLGEHPETPLHWAASADDIDAIDALLDAGADIDAPGAVIGSGTAMADATAFGQWNAARRLLERGAATTLFEAATLGLVEDVEQHLAADAPSAEAITSSFWGACHGGHVTTAQVLLDAGADINWVGYDDLTPLDAAHRAESPAVIEWLKQHDASSTGAPHH